MADVGLRDLGSFVPGGRTGGREPVAPPIPDQAKAAPTVIPMPPPARAAGFGAEADVDALGLDGTLDQLADLVANARTATPLCVGLLGGGGSGKSFALSRLSARIAALAEAAGALGHGPFLPTIHLQPIDAASLEGEPATAVAARLHAGLRRPYPELARELGHSARDPHIVLRETNEKLDDARRRLDSERRALDDAGSRRARLTETVLYEAAGSQVDAYARANRASIEGRLLAFGLPGDPIRTYKDLVQLVAGSGGKLGLGLRSIWGFKGQTKLIVAAIVLVAIGIGLGIAIEQQAVWLNDLGEGPRSTVTFAAWARAHIGWLQTERGAAFLLAGLAILANLWRAFAFMRPILKGARLLDGDLDTRRRDLDGLYAHQTKRVDTLDADVERLTLAGADAERRAGGGGGDGSPFAPTSGAAQARQAFDALTGMMEAPSGVAAPRRVVLVLDNLESVAPARAREILDGLHRTTGRGVVVLAAIDPTSLGAGDALARWVQVSIRLEAGAASRDYAGFVDGLLGRGTARPATPKPDARRSLIDDPLGDDEAALLSAVGGLAGPAPRGVRRLVDLYRLARHGHDRRGALALMPALAVGGTDAERHEMAATLAGDRDVAAIAPSASPRLRAAIEAAIAHDGRLDKADAIGAARRAATFGA